ncbi:WRKY transcription factor 55 [Bienertia sinuspersici]
MEGSNNNEIFRSLLDGCELAKKFEYDLYNNSFVTTNGSPLIIISKRCDEIIKMFSVAKEQLDSMHPPPLDHHHHHQQEMVVDAGYEQHQGNEKGKEVAELSMKVVESARDQDKQHGMMEFGGSSSSAQQKNPKRSSRSYYRCTHQKLYNCPAKKQVQRLDEDPNTFEILYRGTHTCHMSNTAPLVPLPLSQAVQGIFISHQQQIATIDSQFYSLLPMDLAIPSSEEACIIFPPQQQQLHRVSSISSSCVLTNTNNNNNNNGEVDPSSVRSHQGGDQTVALLNNQSLVDWNEMFNFGSSGRNSMEAIFPSFTADIKWENKDIKN